MTVLWKYFSKYIFKKNKRVIIKVTSFHVIFSNASLIHISVLVVIR